jgi:hypothetical protein
VSTAKTKLTELGTALGLVFDPGRPWPASIERLSVPGIPDEVWRPLVLPITAGGPHRDRDLLLRAIDNGRSFRRAVLDDRPPHSVEWVGGAQAVWTSDVPRDLTVDRVYFIQAKYDSTCVLNTAPGTMIDELLADDGSPGRPSWFEEVAPRQLQAYYRAVRGHHDLAELPTDVRDLGADHRDVLKSIMRAAPPGAAEDDAYEELCREVSEQTARRWRRRLQAATARQQSEMLFRMLRIAGGPYWLLGTKGNQPVRLAVDDTRAWRQHFELRRFTVTDAHAGQPQVDWRAEIHCVVSGERRFVDGYCELRWSHGKLQGHPECKVQVTTPLGELPGYRAMEPV